jgi:hypothetical protein
VVIRSHAQSACNHRESLYEGVFGEKNEFLSPIKRGAMMIRSTLSILYMLTVLASSASAQGLAIDPNSYRPTFRLPLQGDTNADTYRRLPYQDLASEIRIELAADILYDFDKGEVRSGAADYFQQAANLIFEEAKGPVRIECRSDRAPPAIGQKLAERCASAIAQWMAGETDQGEVHDCRNPCTAHRHQPEYGQSLRAQTESSP